MGTIFTAIVALLALAAGGYLVFMWSLLRDDCEIHAERDAGMRR